VSEARPPSQAARPAPPGDATLAEILRAAAAFLAEYEQEIPAIVSEEQYNQRGTGGSGPLQTRRLRSDTLVIADAEQGWIGFRDVFEVNGRAVRNRDERLTDLFLKPHADRLAQARRIAAESARFNLNTGEYAVQRTINMPMTALRFLRGPEQGRSTFELKGEKRIDGVETSVVSFEEQAMPRLISSPDDSAASGRFWIDARGRVLESELTHETSMETRTGPHNLRDHVTVRTIIKVTYGEDPRVKLWMPLSMEEQYRVGGVLLHGKATYSNFRRFTVDTATVIKESGNP
jgi:hypothetical protein